MLGAYVADDPTDRMLGRLDGGPLSAIATRRGRMATNPVPRVVGISTCFRLDGLWRAWVAFHYLADCQRFCCPCPPLGLRQKITRHMTYTHTHMYIVIYFFICLYIYLFNYTIYFAPLREQPEKREDWGPRRRWQSRQPGISSFAELAQARLT